jgi:SAM-dependent methyltransferase
VQGLALRDQSIADDIADIFAHNSALVTGNLKVQVRGGVAQLHGTFPSDADREAVRRSISRIRGIHAVWDLADCDGQPRLRCIDIGCGNARQFPVSLGIDYYRTPATGLLADLDRGLPFADASIDRVFAVHVLEHVHDLFGVLNEVHRVLRSGGTFHVMVPDARHTNAIADPTHIRYFNLQTFKYFCRPQPAMKPFWPLLASSDGASIFADLRPLPLGATTAPDTVLARFFD